MPWRSVCTSPASRPLSNLEQGSCCWEPVYFPCQRSLQWPPLACSLWPGESSSSPTSQDSSPCGATPRAPESSTSSSVLYWFSLLHSPRSSFRADAKLVKNHVRPLTPRRRPEELDNHRTDPFSQHQIEEALENHRQRIQRITGGRVRS